MEFEVATESNPTIPEPPGYVNPLESSSRWYLYARAQAIRQAANLGFSIANRTEPPAPSPTKEIWLDSTLSEYKGKQKIKVEVWVPVLKEKKGGSNDKLSLRTERRSWKGK